MALSPSDSDVRMFQCGFNEFDLRFHHGSAKKLSTPVAFRASLSSLQAWDQCRVVA